MHLFQVNLHSSIIPFVQCENEFINGQWRAEKLWCGNDRKQAVPEILLVSSTFRREKLCQSHVNYYIKNAGCFTSYLSCEFGRQVHLQAKRRSERTPNYTMAKILYIHMVSLEICEKNIEERVYLRCLKPACFATHWIVWLCKKVKFSLFLKQLNVKTLGWDCLLD